MNPDTARTCCATAAVLSVAAIVLLGATGCKECAAYVACCILLIMSAFIGATQTPC